MAVCCLCRLQLSTEQGRISQLQAENTAGGSELESLRSTVAELRQQLEGAQVSKVGTRAGSARVQRQLHVVAVCLDHGHAELSAVHWPQAHHNFTLLTT